LARKTGQIVGRGRHRWLVRIFLGRERETRKRRYHNRTIHGTARRAQEYLTKSSHDGCDRRQDFALAQIHRPGSQEEHNRREAIRDMNLGPAR
jgi:hypothetical protein